MNKSLCCLLYSGCTYTVNIVSHHWVDTVPNGFAKFEFDNNTFLRKPILKGNSVHADSI